MGVLQEPLGLPIRKSAGNTGTDQVPDRVPLLVCHLLMGFRENGRPSCSADRSLKLYNSKHLDATFSAQRW